MAKRIVFHVSAVLFDLGLSCAAIAVFAYLSFCSNKDGLCFPSVKSVSRRCGISENTVRKAIRELIAAGILESQPSYTPARNGSRRQSANRYLITLPHCNGCTPARDEGGPVQGLQGMASPAEGEINDKDIFIMRYPSVGHNGELEELIEHLELGLYDNQGFAAAVDDAIRYMFNTDSIMVSGRSVPRGQVRNILRQLTIDHIDHVQFKLADTTETITNSTAYLVSCIYNSVADEAIARIRSGC